MIDLYYWPTPNGHKVTMFLEEAGLEYRIHPVDISAGDQFKPEFLAFSPNNRMPAIIDMQPVDGGEPVTVFESGAILVYLGVLSRNRRKFRQPINVACPAPGRWGRPNSRVTSRHFDHGNASRTSRPDCSGLDEAD